VAKAKEVLQRKTFSASRLDEYASVDGLTKLTGQPLENWPLVIIKELIDNALDNAENTGVAPEIKVTVGLDGIKVEDNGSGIPAATVKALTNYSVRTSSNAAYVAPTRGQQGNALQSILPMGFALDGEEGKTLIESHGRAHTVRFTIDPVRRTPVVNIDASTSEVKNGTRVTAYWPDSAERMIEKANFHELVDAYRFLNPHLTLDLNDDDAWEATSPGWSKWKPNQPPSPHWYNGERMRQHIAAEIAHAEDRKKPCPTVRDFLANFRGLSGTTKANEIGAQLKLAERETLRDFFERGDVQALIVAMRNASRKVKPRDLGVIGQGHLALRLEDGGCEVNSIVYRKHEMELDSLPYVIEVAFGYRGDDGAATVIEGFNFAPAVGGSPFSLEGRLAGAEVDSEDPVTVIAHIACPRFTFTDKGKTRVALPPWVNIKLTEMVTSATKAWTKQKRAEIRDHNAWERRHDRMSKPEKPMSQKEAFEQIAAQAYASAAGTVGLATQRQVFYGARRLMLALLGSAAQLEIYLPDAPGGLYGGASGRDGKLGRDRR
jgi:Histidine kinase-, DNA gyrase B-, and HSP90-like ATPase